MKLTSLVFLSALSFAMTHASASEKLIPAGSLIQCTVGEPKINSKTMAIGDPVLCQAGHSERYGRSVLPYNSYLVGRFEDYKDPGHFVGKGWMELKFERMIVEPDTVIPLNARVVDVPGYAVDNQGRILGKGHAVRDTVTWMIPILWPIDLLELPRRGPRPTLKEETRVTLKVMDDLMVPVSDQPYQDPSGLMRRPQAEAAPPPPVDDEQSTPPTTAYEPPQEQPQAYAYPQPQVYAYVPPPPLYYAPVPLMVYAPMPLYAPRPMYGFYAPPRFAAPAYAPRGYVVARGGYVR